MSSTSQGGPNGKIIDRIFSGIRNRLHKQPRIRLDRETMRHLDAPAKLVVWQEEGGVTDGGVTYDSLREALRNAPETPDARTFIITESGHIIRPLQIAKARQFLEAAG